MLAAIYGRIGLARALGLKLADYLGLERLCAIDPLANVANWAAQRVIRAVVKLWPRLSQARIGLGFPRFHGHFR